MKIIQVARRFVVEDWGGAETVIFETAKRLLTFGHATEIYCTNATARTDAENLDGLHVRRYPYFYPYLGLSAEAKDALNRKGGSPFSFQLMNALDRVPKPDLFHLHTGNRIGGIARYVARKKRIPYVVSLHGGVFDVPREEVEAWAAPTRGALDFGKVLGWWVGSRRVLHDAGAILCVGYPESVEVVKRFPGKRVVYLPNGADTRRFAQGDGPAFRRAYGIPADARVMLTLARIDSQKNQLLPVRLLPDLLKIEPKTHVLIVGSVTNQEYHENLLRTAQRLGVTEHLTVIPGIAADKSDLQNAYHAADVFLLPSIHEPFGIVIVEAWAAGKPVIASRIGGIPHFVEHGTDGLLFNPDDDATFLEAFRTMMGNPELARTLAEAGHRKAVDQFDWNRITERLVEVYEEVCRENPLRQ